jgi:cell division transport system permease protein
VSQRQEIEVSQLIGATASDVRRPFLYHGLIQGALAGMAAVAQSWAVAFWVGAELRALTPDYASELRLVFPPLIEWLAVVGLAGALGLLGAYWAVGRELRQFSPSR